jgi:hypothetical protein
MSVVPEIDKTFIVIEVSFPTTVMAQPRATRHTLEACSLTSVWMPRILSRRFSSTSCPRGAS